MKQSLTKSRNGDIGISDDFREIVYRGYVLTAILVLDVWQVAIWPSDSNLPKPGAGQGLLTSLDVDQALVESQARVDAVLANCKP
jgi:hypothetical protein